MYNAKSVSVCVGYFGLGIYLESRIRQEKLNSVFNSKFHVVITYNHNPVFIMQSYLAFIRPNCY